jgi:hypothetical protein
VPIGQQHGSLVRTRAIVTGSAMALFISSADAIGASVVRRPRTSARFRSRFSKSCLGASLRLIGDGRPGRPIRCAFPMTASFVIRSSFAMAAVESSVIHKLRNSPSCVSFHSFWQANRLITSPQKFSL